jgi:hypothetical protein
MRRFGAVHDYQTAGYLAVAISVHTAVAKGDSGSRHRCDGGALAKSGCRVQCKNCFAKSIAPLSLGNGSCPRGRAGAFCGNEQARRAQGSAPKVNRAGPPRRGCNARRPLPAHFQSPQNQEAVAGALQNEACRFRRRLAFPPAPSLPQGNWTWHRPRSKISCRICRHAAV